MAIIGNFVKETTSTTGTGTYSLAGAVAGSQGFVAGIGAGNTTMYSCTDGANWEVGYGVVTSGSPNTLTRNVIASSNSNAAVAWSAGVKSIFCAIPAQRSVFANEGGTALQGVPNGSVTSAMLASSLSLITPALGVATATSLAVNGATIGTNALAVTGTTALAGALTVSSGGAAVTGNSTVTGTLGVTGNATLGNGSTNFVQFGGAATGSAPFIKSQGSDAYVDLIFATGGSGGIGSLFLQPGSGAIVNVPVSNWPSYTFNASFSGNTWKYVATSFAGVIQQSGADGSITINTAASGSAGASLSQYAQVKINHTASASNYLTLTGSNGGAPTIGTSGSHLMLSASATRVIVNNGSNTYGLVTAQYAGAGADLKNWTYGTFGTSDFNIQADNDAFTLATAAYTISRGTTYNVASHRWWVSSVAGTAIGAFAIDASITALATNATKGFPVMPTCAGTPTGVPAGGNGSFIYDTTNNKLWVYNGAWKGAVHS